MRNDCKVDLVHIAVLVKIPETPTNNQWVGHDGVNDFSSQSTVFDPGGDLIYLSRLRGTWTV